MDTFSANKIKYRPSGKLKALNAFNAAISAVRIFCGIYVLADLIFWVAYISDKVNKESLWYLAFMPVWKIAEIFYTFNPKVESDTDFTGLVSVTVLIVCIVMLKSLSDIVVEYTETLQSREIRNFEKKLRKENAQKEAAEINPQTCGFLFLMKTDITREEGASYGQKNSAEDIKALKIKLRNLIISNVNKNNIIRKGLYRNNLFIGFNDIKYADEFIDYVRKTLILAEEEFSSTDIKIVYTVVFDIMNSSDELTSRVEMCEIINYLNFKNEFLCTKEFKDTYLNGFAPSYAMSPKGVYNLSRNLNIVNNKELFSLKTRQ